MQITCFSYQILKELEFSRQIFEKISNVKFHENLSSASRDVLYGQRDVHAGRWTERQK